jgi:DNA-binding SARP family transcriptional activator
LAVSRIYVTGQVAIEHGSTLVDERQLAGRQGRLAFVYLVLHRHVPAPRADLAAAIWDAEPDVDVDRALNPILSKLRAALKRAHLDEAGIDSRLGTVSLRLPLDTRIDVEDAGNAIDEAGGALRAGDCRRAWASANVAVSVARRPLLPNEDAAWIEAHRRKLKALLLRGLEILSLTSAQNGEPALGVQYATELVDIEPFRETAYQQLMRMHAANGNRGEALRVFERCRTVLRDELGASPSPQTEALFLDILRAVD